MTVLRYWSMGDLSSFIAGLPKAELHVHHIGSASPEIVSSLASKYAGSTPVPADLDALTGYFTFRDFAHFVEVYLSVVDLIREPEDVVTLTTEIARSLAGQQVRYAELTVTPYTLMARGMDAGDLCAAIEDVRRRAESEWGLVLRWCFDIPGETGIPGAEETLRVALTHRPDGLVAFGLGGPEIGVPRPQFKPYFDQAIAAGLRSVPHAGETTGPETIWDAVTVLRADRIGHGTSVMRDPELVKHLVERNIPLEVSPTSNVCTKAVPSLESHPLPAMRDAGLTVTINSDDPPMFGTTLTREYEIAAGLLELDAAGVAELAKTAIDVSFADAAVKTRVREEIDAHLAAAQ